MHCCHCVLCNIYPISVGLWGLINNVGISGEIGPFEWFDRNGIERLFQVNVLGTVSIVQAFLPLIKKCGSGRIVNTTSILGRVSVPFAGPYCMTKFALEAFSNSLRYSKFLLFIPYNIWVYVCTLSLHVHVIFIHLFIVTCAFMHAYFSAVENGVEKSFEYIIKPIVTNASIIFQIFCKDVMHCNGKFRQN